MREYIRSTYDPYTLPSKMLSSFLKPIYYIPSQPLLAARNPNPLKQQFLTGSGGDFAPANFPHSSILAWRIPWTKEPGGL